LQQNVEFNNVENEFDEENYNIIINFKVLKTMFNDCICKECCLNGSKLLLKNNLQNKNGFSYELQLSCDTCEFISKYNTSLQSHKQISPGKPVASVNFNAIVAFRELGKGYQSLRTFAAFMNMPPPMTPKNFNYLTKKLYKAYETVAIQSTTKAACQARMALCVDHNEPINCQVSVDGTWQKRGHQSLNGIVTIISKENGKCLDTIVLSKKCRGCSYWKTKTLKPGYFHWKLNHVCDANHEKSSGAMESCGAVILFSRSLMKNNLRYTSYIGDGDTSSFSDVVSSKPYGNINIEKLECVGHVQKRMGTCLRNLRKSQKGKKLIDSKLGQISLSGKGKLTDKAINLFQNYYGMAIRQNVDNFYNMQKSVWAVLFHNSDIEDENTRHQFCPRSNTSWCLWQSDKLTNLFKY